MSSFKPNVWICLETGLAEDISDMRLNKNIKTNKQTKTPNLEYSYSFFPMGHEMLLVTGSSTSNFL